MAVGPLLAAEPQGDRGIGDEPLPGVVDQDHLALRARRRSAPADGGDGHEEGDPEADGSSSHQAVLRYPSKAIESAVT